MARKEKGELEELQQVVFLYCAHITMLTDFEMIGMFGSIYNKKKQLPPSPLLSVRDKDHDIKISQNVTPA